MPGSNCETWSQICDDLASNIWYSAASVLTLNGRITASEYVDIFGSKVHHMVQVLFPNNDAIFQDDLPICAVRSVQFWFEENEDAFQQLLWPARSPTLNIIEPFWSVLESRVRSRFPPSSLKQLDEEQYSNPLQTIQEKMGPSPY